LHHLAASTGSGEAARQGSPDVGEIAMTRLQSIEHFVVLMLENRSFDNLLGGLYPKSKDFDGVDGSESNTDRSGKVWPLTETPGGDVAGLSVPNPDPGELWQDINVQIFGSGQLHEIEPYPPRAAPSPI
jgi:phospholipase C